MGFEDWGSDLSSQKVFIRSAKVNSGTNPSTYPSLLLYKEQVDELVRELTLEKRLSKYFL